MLSANSVDIHEIRLQHYSSGCLISQVLRGGTAVQYNIILNLVTACSYIPIASVIKCGNVMTNLVRLPNKH